MFCTDGKDNDENGDTDCNDEGCIFHPACVGCSILPDAEWPPALAGELEVDATLPRTPGGEIQCHGGYLAFARWLLCHDEPRHRLYAAEVGVDGATWEEVGGALAGHIASLFVSDDGALLVGSDVGGIWESVDRVAWTQRDQLTFGPASMPLVVHALGRLPDGAMVALAQHASWSNARVLVRPAQ